MNAAQLLPNVCHLASFCATDRRSASLNLIGGNPAGVLLCEQFPKASVMLEIAAAVGYSETAFVVPEKTGFAVRYFAPTVEVAFCGHATIALGQVLREKYGAKSYRLRLGMGELQLDASQSKIQISSPPTTQRNIDEARVAQYLSHTNVELDDLHPNIRPMLINAGNDHLLLCLQERQVLARFRYEFAPVRSLMQEDGVLTLAVLVIGDENPSEQCQDMYIRNPFPGGGVYEDPATGSAAAAVSGWVRDQHILPVTKLRFYQGEEMDVPCLLETQFSGNVGSAVQLSGMVRPL